MAERVMKRGPDATLGSHEQPRTRHDTRGSHPGERNSPPDIALADADLGSWDFWGLDDDIRDGAFATLRREAPIRFFDAFVADPDAEVAGHWALTRYDDVFYASRHPEIFSSALGIVIGDQSPELAEYFGSMIAMDDPRHTRLRNIVRSAFTPKVLALIEDSVRARAARLVADMVANHPDGRADLVAEFSGPLRCRSSAT